MCDWQISYLLLANNMIRVKSLNITPTQSSDNS